MIATFLPWFCSLLGEAAPGVPKPALEAVSAHWLIHLKMSCFLPNLPATSALNFKFLIPVSELSGFMRQSLNVLTDSSADQYRRGKRSDSADE